MRGRGGCWDTDWNTNSKELGRQKNKTNLAIIQIIIPYDPLKQCDLVVLRRKKLDSQVWMYQLSLSNHHHHHHPHLPKMMTLCLWKTVKYRGSVGQCPGLVLDQSLRVSFMLLSIFICCKVSIASSSSQSMTIWSRFLEFIYTEIKCRLSLWSQVPEEFDLLLVQLHQRYRCLFFAWL